MRFTLSGTLHRQEFLLRLGLSNELLLMLHRMGVGTLEDLMDRQLVNIESLERAGIPIEHAHVIVMERDHLAERNPTTPRRISLANAMNSPQVSCQRRLSGSRAPRSPLFHAPARGVSRRPRLARQVAVLMPAVKAHGWDPRGTPSWAPLVPHVNWACSKSSSTGFFEHPISGTGSGGGAGSAASLPGSDVAAPPPTAAETEEHVVKVALFSVPSPPLL